MLRNYEPPHDKTNKMTAPSEDRSAWTSFFHADSEDSDQTERMPRLILIRLGRCPGWSESSLGAHAILLVLSWGGSYFIHLYNRPVFFIFQQSSLDDSLKIWVCLSYIMMPLSTSTNCSARIWCFFSQNHHQKSHLITCNTRTKTSRCCRQRHIVCLSVCLSVSLSLSLSLCLSVCLSLSLCFSLSLIRVFSFAHIPYYP